MITTINSVGHWVVQHERGTIVVLQAHLASFTNLCLGADSVVAQVDNFQLKCHPPCKFSRAYFVTLLIYFLNSFFPTQQSRLRDSLNHFTIFTVLSSTSHADMWLSELITQPLLFCHSIKASSNNILFHIICVTVMKSLIPKETAKNLG